MIKVKWLCYFCCFSSTCGKAEKQNHWSDLSLMQQHLPDPVKSNDVGGLFCRLRVCVFVPLSPRQHTSSSSVLSSAALSMSLSFFMMRLTDSSWKSAVSYSRALSPYSSVCSDIARLLLSWGPIMNPLHLMCFQPSDLVWWIKTNKDRQPACNIFKVAIGNFTIVMKIGMWS